MGMRYIVYKLNCSQNKDMVEIVVGSSKTPEFCRRREGLKGLGQKPVGEPQPSPDDGAR